MAGALSIYVLRLQFGVYLNVTYRPNRGNNSGLYELQMENVTGIIDIYWITKILIMQLYLEFIVQ